MPEGAGTDADGGGEAGAEGARGIEVGAGGAEEDGPSNPRARALRVPGNMIVGSFKFQQFFFMYAKLMAGLKDSKVRESDTTPLDMQSAVIKAGKTSLEELDWAIWEI